MAYGRRNFAAYQRGDPQAKGDKSLASYRNKTIVFIVATAAYTAFLYSSGTPLLLSVERQALPQLKLSTSY
jgi:hypothetical protein